MPIEQPPVKSAPTPLLGDNMPESAANQDHQPAATDWKPQVQARPRQSGDSLAAPSSVPTLVSRVIWYVGGLVSILLAFRFVLALLGANITNAFAQLIYNVTTPLVSPFFSLFGYTPTYGASTVEVFTLVAIAVYALVAWGLVKLVTITRPNGLS